MAISYNKRVVGSNLNELGEIVKLGGLHASNKPARKDL